MADKQIYVDPDVAAGDSSGDSWTNAYSSLNIAEAAEEADITGAGVYYFHGKSRLGNADTTAVTFLGWTTDATHWIQVQGGYAAGESGTPGTPEGLSAYSTSHYYLTVSDADAITIREDYVRIDGIQIAVTITSVGRGCYVYGQNAGNDIRISNSIIQAPSVAGTGAGRGIEAQDADTIISIWNCIVYGFISGVDSGFIGIYPSDCATADIWNCTINDCYAGIRRGAGTVTVINCLIFECTDDFVSTITMTYCASDDDHTGDSATNFVITQTADDYAALVTDADGGDYKVTDGSSELVGTGTDDPGDPIQDHTDIALTTRSSTWDIGAFELITGTPSASISASPSASISASISASPSASISASISASPSASISASLSASPSASISASISASPSASISASPSASPSASISASPSASISASVSASPSASPSAGVGTIDIHIFSSTQIEPNDATDNAGSVLIQDGLEVQGNAWMAGTAYIDTLDAGEGTIKSVVFGSIGPGTFTLTQASTILTVSSNTALNQDVDTTASPTFAGLAISTNDIVLPKTSGKGIKVDTATPTFGWRDLLGAIIPKARGGTAPAFTAFRGTNVKEYAFQAADIIEDITYHIPHDYVLGSDIHLHLHWGHNGTAISDSLVVDYYLMYAKGHGQAVFNSEINITQTISAPDVATRPQWGHEIDEIQISNDGGDATHLDRALLEPDGVIKLSLITTTIPTITGSATSDLPYLFTADIHYQSTNIATKDKVGPGFYT